MASGSSGGHLRRGATTGAAKRPKASALLPGLPAHVQVLGATLDDAVERALELAAAAGLAEGGALLEGAPSHALLLPLPALLLHRAGARQNATAASLLRSALMFLHENSEGRAHNLRHESSEGRADHGGDSGHDSDRHGSGAARSAPAGSASSTEIASSVTEIASSARSSAEGRAEEPARRSDPLTAAELAVHDQEPWAAYSAGGALTRPPAAQLHGETIRAPTWTFLGEKRAVAELRGHSETFLGEKKKAGAPDTAAAAAASPAAEAVDAPNSERSTRRSVAHAPLDVLLLSLLPAQQPSADAAWQVRRRSQRQVSCLLGHGPGQGQGHGQGQGALAAEAEAEGTPVEAWLRALQRAEYGEGGDGAAAPADGDTAPRRGGVAPAGGASEGVCACPDAPRAAALLVRVQSIPSLLRALRRQPSIASRAPTPRPASPPASALEAARCMRDLFGQRTLALPRELRVARLLVSLEEDGAPAALWSSTCGVRAA